MAVAIPAIIAAVGAIGGSAAASKISANAAKNRQREALRLSPEESRAQTGAFGLADIFGGRAASLYGQGTGNLGQASTYYQTLLGKGGRGAMTSAVAPAAESISDLYGGIGRGLEGSNVRGGVRDLALAEAEREKVGKISRLTAGVQPMAAGELSDIGRFQTGAGLGASGQAGSIFANLLGQGRENRGMGIWYGLESDRRSAELGQNIGALLFAILSGMGGGGGGSRGTVPNLGGSRFPGMTGATPGIG